MNDVFRGALEDGEHVVLVASANGRFPIGQMLVAFRSEAPGIGVLSHLVVLGGFRDQGLGTALLEEGERLLREHRVSESQLSVEKINSSAKRLYERLGYRVVGEAIETWPEPVPDQTARPVDHPAWVMRKRL